MIPARWLTVTASAVALASLASSARAQSWDLIYADRVEITLCEDCGLTLAGTDFALLVNTGGGHLDGTTLSASTFPCGPPDDSTCTIPASQPGFRLDPFINGSVAEIVAPILPGEAVGSVTPDNTVLLGPVASGETFRNSTPMQFLAFHIWRHAGNPYEGEVVFDIEMNMGGARALFQIRANMLLGTEGGIRFLSAARVSSVPKATPARTTSWGKIKALYR